jgi:hypothetical protein
MSSILKGISDTMQLVEFDGEKEVARAFWTTVLLDPSGKLPSKRLDGFLRLTRSVTAARHYLRRFSERDAIRLAFTKDTSDNAREAHLLKQFACVFYHVLGRKPGRSKSTVGPFVRFAWAAMAPVVRKRMPPIDALNDKWARLQYDVAKTRFGLSVEEFDEFYS